MWLRRSRARFFVVNSLRGLRVCLSSLADGLRFRKAVGFEDFLLQFFELGRMFPPYQANLFSLGQLIRCRAGNKNRTFKVLIDNVLGSGPAINSSHNRPA